jgi:HEAT repeat protein
MNTMPATTFEKLNDRSNAERWKYALELANFGPDGVQYLVLALKDTDKWVRYLATDGLGNIQETSAVDALVKQLEDKDQDVRFAAAEDLGKIGDARAAEALAQHSTCDNGYVCIAIEEALQRLNKKN